MGLKAGQVAQDIDLAAIRALANQAQGRFFALTLTEYTSTSYVNVPGASVSFTKILSAGQSNVEISIDAQAYGSTGTGGHLFLLGARINNVDVDVCKYFFNAYLDHRQFSGSELIVGLGAGAYTVQLRAKNGTTTKGTSIGPDDLAIVKIREIPIIS